ncbi:PlsC domain-containing protein [Psidium guajava]|nr:PlsC domain-containing protein [Psidium guajava]
MPRRFLYTHPIFPKYKLSTLLFTPFLNLCPLVRPVSCSLLPESSGKPARSQPEMAAAIPTVGTVNGAPLNLNGSNTGASAPSSAFFGSSLKKVTQKLPKAASPSGSLRVRAMDGDEDKQTEKDKWRGLAYDTSDDHRTHRGKGMVDYLFQAPMGTGTHHAIMSSYDYISTGLRQYDFDNTMGGFYIAPAFMDKLVVHITKNFMTLPNIKVPLILGIWGGKGQGKSFQCELVFAKMGINPIMMSAGELESGNAGEPAKLIRQRYREAADIIKKGKMCCLFINDLDAGAGRMADHPVHGQ